MKDVLVAAVIYLACRIEGYPRTLKEIAAASNLPMKSISKIYSSLSRTLEVDTGRVLPEDIVGRFASNLQLSHSIRSTALHICQSVSRLDLCEGISPHSIAAAALGIAMILHKHILDIDALAETAMGNVSAIRKTYTILLSHARDVLPQEHVESLSLLPAEL